MRQTGLCLFGFHVNGTEEPDVGNLHVRVCGGSGRVIGCFYPEPGRCRSAQILSLGVLANIFTLFSAFSALNDSAGYAQSVTKVFKQIPKFYLKAPPQTPSQKMNTNLPQ